MKISLILQADSYKYSHFKLFPRGIKNNNSYIEARGIDETSGLPRDTEIVFFGLQAFIKEYLITPITKEDVDKAEKLIPAHGLPFNRADWDIIVDEFHGRLPIQIQAIPEGSIIRPHVAMVQVRATDKRFAWLASFVETAILRAVWYPTTVATLSRETKKVIKKYLDLSCDTPDTEILFKLHDFGARGVSSSESAQLGGMAHLVNFMGTDTVEALVAAMEYYGVDGPAGYSVPASEHSTITSWGRDHEKTAYENMVDLFAKPGSIISCVSDSYDIFNACENLWPSLRYKIKETNSTLVVRPDSGNPMQVLPVITKSLAAKFGTTTNEKGFKVLDNVRILWGDGINIKTIDMILDLMTGIGFSAENFVFGMGGALLQKVNRDTLKFAMKTSAVLLKDDATWRDVFKEPINEPFKKSKAGIQDTRIVDGAIVSGPIDTLPEGESILRPVFNTGFILYQQTLEDVRAKAKV